MVSASAARGRRSRPIEREQVAHELDVGDARDVAQHVGALGQQRWPPSASAPSSWRRWRGRGPRAGRWGARRCAPSGPQYAPCRPPSVRRPLPHRGHGPQLSGARPGRARHSSSGPGRTSSPSGPRRDNPSSRSSGRAGRRPASRPRSGRSRPTSARSRPEPARRRALRRHRADALRAGHPALGVAVRPRSATSCAASTAGTTRGTRGGRRPTASTPRAARVLGLLCTVSLVAGYLGTRHHPDDHLRRRRVRRERPAAGQRARRRPGRACSSPSCSWRWPTGGAGAAACSAPPSPSCASPRTRRPRAEPVASAPPRPSRAACRWPSCCSSRSSRPRRCRPELAGLRRQRDRR